LRENCGDSKRQKSGKLPRLIELEIYAGLSLPYTPAMDTIPRGNVAAAQDLASNILASRSQPQLVQARDSMRRG